METITTVFTEKHVLFPASFAIRLALVVYGDYQDRTMEVKYTDIDYHVFTDAARFISEGASPYARSTYRYTPLLAWMLLPNIYLSLVAGKMLFVACDVLSGLLLYQILRLRGLNSEAACRLCSLWLLNPLPMGVSTRGNAESMMAALVLATLLCLTAKRLWWAAFLYGLSVHMKIYPVTYALPIALTLRTPAAHTERAKRTSVVAFIGSFLNRELLLFAGVSSGVFFMLTGLFYYKYGWEFLHETYFYHLTRRDTRHNFSPYFYMLYLSGGITPESEAKVIFSVALKVKSERILPLSVQTAGGAFIWAWPRSSRSSSCCWWPPGPSTLIWPSAGSCTPPSLSLSTKCARHSTSSGTCASCPW